MSLAIVHTRARIGLDAPPVTVEVHLIGGLPAVNIVGLPETAVRESRDRVRSAIMNTRFKFPKLRITVNLAPADLPKEGGRFDLPIALGILAASNQLPAERLPAHEFVGELALTGELRTTRSTLSAALRARELDRALVVPLGDADEAGLVAGARVLPAASLLDVFAHLEGTRRLAAHETPRGMPDCAAGEDLADVYGQFQARRALEITAAGGHNLLFIGPPGTGKTMLASRLPGILPPMSEEEALESAAVHSVSSLEFDPARWGRRPFRAPHHTASGVALVGGGSVPRPGEISLAHHGVLFLDELPEFDRRVLEVLREPLESGRITVSRAARQADFPSRVLLVAAMNPCPCGHLGDERGRCRCTEDQVHRYRARISGPLLDRIDLHVEVPRVRLDSVAENGPAPGEPSAAVRARVVAARERQHARAGKENGRLAPEEIRRHCALETAGARLLESSVEKLGLSARARHRVLRVARTIADLGESERIDTAHLAEAIGYRSLDRVLAPTG